MISLKKQKTRFPVYITQDIDSESKGSDFRDLPSFTVSIAAGRWWNLRLGWSWPPAVSRRAVYPNDFWVGNQGETTDFGDPRNSKDFNISSDFIRFHQISSDFIRFHQISSDFIRFHQIFSVGGWFQMFQCLQFCSWTCSGFDVFNGISTLPDRFRLLVLPDSQSSHCKDPKPPAQHQLNHWLKDINSMGGLAPQASSDHLSASPKLVPRCAQEEESFQKNIQTYSNSVKQRFINTLDIHKTL